MNITDDLTVAHFEEYVGENDMGMQVSYMPKI